MSIFHINRTSSFSSKISSDFTANLLLWIFLERYHCQTVISPTSLVIKFQLTWKKRQVLYFNSSSYKMSSLANPSQLLPLGNFSICFLKYGILSPNHILVFYLGSHWYHSSSNMSFSSTLRIRFIFCFPIFLLSPDPSKATDSFNIQYATRVNGILFDNFWRQVLTVTHYLT